MESDAEELSCVGPELIFITNANQEFIFTLYPGSNAQVEMEFQQLMEYLLTKINHRDEAAVRAAYGIYEMTLEEGYSIMDIRETIMKAKQREIAEEADRRRGEEEKENSREHGTVHVRTREARRETRTGGKSAGDVGRKNRAGIKEFCRGEYPAEQAAQSSCRQNKEEHRGKERKKEKEKGKEAGRDEKESVRMRFLAFLRKQLGLENARPLKIQDAKQRDFDREAIGAKDADALQETLRAAGSTNVVYPEEEIYVPEEEVHPTVYLGSLQGKPQGILLYQGMERLEDIRLEEHTVRIGHGADADIRIDHETVSQMHARIDWDGENYYIEDLNSTNGTYVNDELLAYKEKRLLRASDMIRFANLRYRFC